MSSETLDEKVSHGCRRGGVTLAPEAVASYRRYRGECGMVEYLFLAKDGQYWSGVGATKAEALLFAERLGKRAQ